MASKLSFILQLFQPGSNKGDTSDDVDSVGTEYGLTLVGLHSSMPRIMHNDICDMQAGEIVNEAGP